MHLLARHVITILAVLSLLTCAALCALSLELHYPVPVGCLLGLSIGWPTAWLWQYCRQRRVLLRRMAAGQCLSCGYDCRATPERCPECGRIRDAVSRRDPFAETH